jgi:hypothetical protein
MDLSCIKKCIRTLLYYKWIIISDIFKFSNIYQITPKVYELFESKNKLENITKFSLQLDTIASTSNSTSTPTSNIITNLPLIQQNILKILLNFKPGLPLLEIIKKYPNIFYGIDIQRLLAITQFEGYIIYVNQINI